MRLRYQNLPNAYLCLDSETLHCPFSLRHKDLKRTHVVRIFQDRETANIVKSNMLIKRLL